MKKIISLYQRNYGGNRLVRDEVVPGAEWVIAGEGRATEKLDGTAAAVIGGRLYKRYDAKRGRTPPEGAIPCQEADPITGHYPHWVLVGEGPEDAAFRDAWDDDSALEDGTYELVGPKVQGNPYGLVRHQLRQHGCRLLSVQRSFPAIATWFHDHPTFEGIVWHHEDGRMVKIKRKDFGLPWPPPKDPA